MTLRVHLTDATKADISAILRWIEERLPSGRRGLVSSLAPGIRNAPRESRGRFTCARE